MNAHMKVDQPDTRHRLDQMAQGVIGQPLDRPEGPLKVSGRATYAHEWNLPGTVYGVLVRGKATKGSVRSMDTDAVKAMPGVLAVIVDERMLRNPAQGGAGEAPVQTAQKIEYFGQAVALVVAGTFEQARHAAQSLAVEIDAQSANVHPAEGKIDPFKEKHLGDIDRAMADAPVTIDVVYTTAGHNSAAMEPHCSIAEWDGDLLTLRGSYQMLKFNRAELADALGIDPSNVRILSPFVGGGFGSKLGIAPEAVAAAIAAKELGRPVVVELTRPQVFDNVVRRSDTRQRVRLAADKDGKLIGFSHEARSSNLPGEDYAEPATQATDFLYGGESRHVVETIARVHRTASGSVRAPGEAVGVPVLENAMDELAEAVGVDPVELRLKNISETDIDGKPHSSRRLAECLTEGAARFGWNERGRPGERRDGEWLIGLGMCSAARANKLQESEARVMLLPDGTARVETDMTDIGTGTYAILTQVAAEMLGLPVSRVTTVLGDTALPPASGSGGSWGASSSSSAVFLACESLRTQLAERMDVAETELTLKDGMAIAGNRQLLLTDVIAGEAMVGHGHIEPGATSEDVRQASYGAFFAEVGVNAVTGETRVRRMLGVFGAGRILNAKTARSQCLGGMTWGIGIALTEELFHDSRDGHIVNRDLAEYHVPVNADVPQIEVVLLDERDDYANPLQAKGIGELAISGAAGCITNAIYNACGVRVRDYPATLDKVLPGLD